MKFRFLFVCVGLAVIAGSLGGCFNLRSNKKILIEDGQYWQRSNSSSTIYMRGPKAQQFLARDIAACAVEIRELTQLNAIRKVVPSDKAVYENTNDPDTPAGELAHWESAQRDGYLRAENLPFNDFETCMIYKGWERVEHLPASIAQESRADYIESIYGQKRRYEFERGGVPSYEDDNIPFETGRDGTTFND